MFAVHNKLKSKRSRAVSFRLIVPSEIGGVGPLSSRFAWVIGRYGYGGLMSHSRNITVVPGRRRKRTPTQ